MKFHIVEQVLLEENSCVRKVTLNRPQKLNSLNFEMVSQIFKALEAYENDSTVKLVILKGKGRAFCAGGDVMGVFHSAFGGHWSFGARFYKKQLALDYLIGTYKKPLVFAMPEASIGLFPDVGATHFLSKLPGHFGEYIGLTGARIKGAEMLACGLATHFVPSKNLPLLESALDQITSSEASTISNLINKFSYKVDVKQDCAFKRLEVINRCFSRETVEEILQSLEKEAADGEEKWIKEAIRSMRSSSPTSLKITLRLGSRALLDKDKNPKWEPSRLELVSKERVNQHFAKIEDINWEKLELHYGRNTTNQAMARL
ncbi:hypothetical protein FEM48_Zijuj03G0026700 [Ziziphus jujuba var. spinosa]|uniref:3-hydroxyisobutyryl-CoA hydrolase n=1 Tax=Ziziphus jujuba var. spinosa TaxID=714518 RepID=A0A978VMP3_ZIZJJ|nr:hypothetical protein FEM48_Zijuj03G0026700 [Ziziphus jujuba var. spinosa]